MPRACAICVHAEKPAIDAALRSGTPYRNVAEQYGVSLGALSRHYANAHTPTTTPLPTATPKPRNGTVKRNTSSFSSVSSKNTHSVVPLSRPQGQHLPPDDIPAVQAHFLVCYRATGVMATAVTQAGIDRRTVLYWIAHDADFAERYADANEDINDSFRAEIRRRAVEGIVEPLVSMGKIVYDTDKESPTYGKPLTTRKYSDSLLMFQTKQRMPEYRDRADPVVANGADLPGLTIIIPHLPESERARYIHQGPPSRIVEAPDVPDTSRSDED